MTTPRHGTRGMYVRGCRCPSCRKANTDGEAARRRRHLYGTPGTYVDSAEAREHLRALRAAGYTLRAIARTTGVSRQTLTRLQQSASDAGPSRTRVHAITAARLLELSPDDLNIATGALVSARGVRRRLQALAAIGWTMPALANQLGRTPANLRRVLASDRVTERTDRQIRALYDRLWNRQPDRSTRRRRAASERARDHARANGWVAPLAWDDIDRDADPFSCDKHASDDVDDMDVDIAVERIIARLPISLTAAERDAVIARLSRSGWSLEDIAEVMGISSRTVSRSRAANVA